MDSQFKAGILIEALPYIQEYYGKIVVVKYGGSAMQSDELMDAVIRDMILLKCVGIDVVMIHGGGPEINEMLKKIGKESKFINGLRYTDKETIDIVQMVLSGKVNKSLVSRIENFGGRALGLCGIDGNMLKAQRKGGDVDYGFVGDVVGVDTRPITDAIDNGYIPVIATLAKDDDGDILNVNADTAAAAIAAALNAEKFILLTDVKGVLHDPHDESTLISVIHGDEVQSLIDEGVISGGMIPKIQCCMHAFNGGVRRTHIIDGRVPHSILIEMLSDSGLGTMIC